VALAEELNQAGLPGIRFVPIRFTPKASVYKDQECGGVYILLTDRDLCRVVDAGLLIASTLQKRYPTQFKLDKISHLLLHPGTLEAVRAGKSIADIRVAWQKDLNGFEDRREKFLIYK